MTLHLWPAIIAGAGFGVVGGIVGQSTVSRLIISVLLVTATYSAIWATR